MSKCSSCSHYYNKACNYFTGKPHPIWLETSVQLIDPTSITTCATYENAATSYITGLSDREIVEILSKYDPSLQVGSYTERLALATWFRVEVAGSYGWKLRGYDKTVMVPEELVEVPNGNINDRYAATLGKLYLLPTLGAEFEAEVEAVRRKPPKYPSKINFAMDLAYRLGVKTININWLQGDLYEVSIGEHSACADTAPRALCNALVMYLGVNNG
jgi:hypothetical protein